MLYLDLGGKMNAHVKHIWSQVVFYMGWLAMIFFETTVWSIAGLVVGFITFLIGGYLWALWHIGNTEAEVKIHGPVLVLMDKMLSRSDKLLLPVASLVGGGPGVGLVLKKQAHQAAKLYSLIASTIYAVVWCVIHALRPQAGVPVEIWPSMEFLTNIRNLF